MRRGFVLGLTVVVFFSIFMYMYAHGGSDHYSENKELKTEIINLKNKYGVDEDKELSSKILNNRELERLGDILMDIMVPNESQHEYMDEMMGGEGSETLEFMHRQMAENYLDGYGIGMMNGHGMMGNHGNMMGGWNQSELEENYLDILKKRLAKGEITTEEYEKLKETLEK